jgi:hypothetical protein
MNLHSLNFNKDTENIDLSRIYLFPCFKPISPNNIMHAENYLVSNYNNGYRN